MTFRIEAHITNLLGEWTADDLQLRPFPSTQLRSVEESHLAQHCSTSQEQPTSVTAQSEGVE